MKVKPQLLGLKMYTPGKPIDEVKREYGLTKIVKLASNENPFGCSEKVLEAISSLGNQFALYPDGASYALRQEVAARVGVNPDQLLFGSGLDEVIQMVSRALLMKGTNTVMATPTFSQYRHHAIIEQAEVREVPLREGTHDLDTMLTQIDEETRIVWICNPNNPTGTYVNEDDLRRFMQQVPKTALVILDEAYYEYATNKDFPNSVALLNEYENVMVLRTFSKAYGLAAFRIGYAIGQVDLIAHLQIGRLPFNTSTLAQTAALAALSDEAFLQQCVAANEKGLMQYYDFCEQYGVTYYPSQTNFIYMEVGNGDEVFQYLLEKGYIVRSGVGLGLPNGIRVTVGNTEENAEILALLAAFMQEKR